MDGGERIARLRQRALERKDSEQMRRLLESPVVTAHSLSDSEGIPSWPVRCGLLTRDRLASMRFAIDDLELLAGRLSLDGWEPQAEYDEAQRALERYPLARRGQTGHCELDLDRVMSVGIDGLAGEIRELARQASAERAEAYQSFTHALEGLSRMIENAAAAAERASSSAPAPRQRELGEIVGSCRRIAHAPPACFRDAIQLLWLVILGVMHGEQAALVVPGHLDRTLLPFYEADLAKEALTWGDALLLIESLYLLVNEYIADGLAISVMVGGRDAEGCDVTNDLSYLSLEALRRTKLIYPTVGICWHEGTPPALVDLAVDLIAKGCPTPAFFGDETIQKGLEALGVPVTRTCRYVNSTCVEITPSGASNVWVASPYYDTCGLLLEEIDVQASDPAPSFPAFLARYHERLALAIREGVAEQNELRRERQQHRRRPLQSVFTGDCLARGQDIEDGGAVYNWIECSFIGLANLADSLNVIREEVYDQRRTTLPELQALLHTDFEGQEEIRLRYLNGYPKYGQDHPEVDRLVGDVVRFVTRECARCTVEPDGSPYVPGAFAWVMHERLGRETGATPDGRKAGFPFADGCGPAQGREHKGPTAAMLSTTSWEHSPMIGGLAYNLKFNSSLFESEEGSSRLRDLILTYLRRGGFEIQVNVVDNETLKRAKAHPEAYRDLVVRIGGYCDYFARLSPEMQDELILRTEFNQI